MADARPAEWRQLSGLGAAAALLDPLRFAAMMTQTAMTLLFGAAQDARVPELGASGTVAAVLGAYFVLYPGSRIRTYIFPVSWSGSRPGSSSGCGSCTSS